ncbi:hypothetical protein NUW58_g3880 [Xylaria curta]|uniref:Uncharacterized protein n=1 Tax=Xylaria curta TaxID=42375 RepID=A0ACC1P8W1_9PEZI|nr:hypothetical protein NUW58_g3880 [Xylaria curta]
MRGQLLVAQMEVLGDVGCPRLVLDPSSGLLDGLSVVEAYLDTPCEAVLVEDMLGRAVKTFNRVGAGSSQTASQVAHSPATSDAGHSIQVWLLHLFNNRQQRYSMFLVLGLSRRKHGCFERIGTSSVTPKTSDANTMFERFLENQPMTEVSII